MFEDHQLIRNVNITPRQKHELSIIMKDNQGETIAKKSSLSLKRNIQQPPARK